MVVKKKNMDMKKGYTKADLYLVHDHEERQLGFVEDAAGIEHRNKGRWKLH